MRRKAYRRSVNVSFRTKTGKRVSFKATRTTRAVRKRKK